MGQSLAEFLNSTTVLFFHVEVIIVKAASTAPVPFSSNTN